MPHPTASILVIGNEVLSNKVEDVNTPFLLEKLRKLGVRVQEVRILPDQPEVLVAAMREAKARSTWVFTTGGVGPTHDDITMDAVAAACECALVDHPVLVELLETLLGDRLQDGHRKMARIPAKAELIFENGARFPVVQVENMFVFPGAPGLMRAKFQQIEERFRASPFHLAKIYLKGDEASYAALLEEAEAAIAGIEIGSYPIYGNPGHDIVVTIEARDPEEVQATLKRLLEGIPNEALVRSEG